MEKILFTTVISEGGLMKVTTGGVVVTGLVVVVAGGLTVTGLVVVLTGG
jgi:hypothetical protein